VKPVWRTTKQLVQRRHRAAVHLGPRIVAAVVTVFLARQSAPDADATTQTASFGVGATVIAGCVVSSLTLERAKGGGSVCAPASSVSNIPVPRPITRLMHDPETGLQTLTVEF